MTRSRTFIVYLEPSGDSALAKHVNTARNLLGTSIGYDESHLYPLHCSLTSFFDVVVPTNDEDQEVLNKAIRDAVTEFLSKRFEGAARTLMMQMGVSPPIKNCWSSSSSTTTTTATTATPTEPRKAAPRWSPSFCSTRSCSARSRSSSLSAFADDGGDEILLDGAAEDPTPIPEIYMPPSSLPSPAACFRVKRQLSTRRTAATKEENTISSSALLPSRSSTATQQQSPPASELKHVHVTPDGSLIYPLTAEGFTNEAIIGMCQALENSIKRALPSADIKGSRKPTPGIQPKQATHMTLLNNKGVQTQDLTWSVQGMAQFLDRAASVNMNAVTEWDVVVNELQRWGSLDGPKGKSGRRFEVVHPHDFVEVCRMRGIGISALQ